MESKLFKTRKNQKIAISTVVLLSVFFLSIFSVRAENTITYVSLPVKLVQQAYSNWCWAAGSESILCYCKNYLGFGKEATQWDIVRYIYGSYVNKGALLSDIQRALSYYGVGSSRMIPISGWIISYGQIAEQIVNYKSPIRISNYSNSKSKSFCCFKWYMAIF
ncbi:papain-like cysteine protease family protein [Caldicellulosiruptor morganii]|uniref:Peptidase C39-like domain-containing protein n=2 Tax=Caldicellulosiruptor morganii TaxID=1387555 RepID=A0ABY7BMY6_9FIRM|nr:papain-like cysteine protease family protein [Caldicellulosiruptor morganii]WAM34218.1 hypothetical protein OTK00_000397 [Caldicellulosiruptor morganii]